MSKCLCFMFAALAGLVLTGCSSRLGENTAMSTLLKTADSAIVERKYTKPGSDKVYLKLLTYGPDETGQIVSAMLGAGSGRGSCQEPVNTVKFYCKSQPVAKIETSSDVFVLLDKLYRSKEQVLSKLVDKAVEGASELEVNTR